MKSFKFTLESALRWRKTILAGEQEKLQVALANHRRLEADARTLEAARRGAVRNQLSSSSIPGSDFRSIAGYLIGLQGKHAQAQVALQQSSVQVQRQKAICADAERRVELLSALKDKRHTAWQKEVDLEFEALANELYLAKRAREGC